MARAQTLSRQYLWALIAVLFAVSIGAASALLAQNKMPVAKDAVSTWTAKLQGYDADILAALGEPGGGDKLNEIAKARYIPKKDFVRASMLFEAGCAIGSAKACHNSSNYFGAGMEGVPKNPAKAFAAAKRACDVDFYISCTSLAFYHWQKTGRKPADEKSAAILWEKACNGGDNRACHPFALSFLFGQGNNVDAVKARAVLDSACKGGDDRSCTMSERVQATPASAQNLTKMGSDIQTAVYADDQGKVLSTFAYDAIKGKQYASALKIFETACELGHMPSCENAALMFNGAHKMPVNKARAQIFAARGCNNSYADSCVTQGALLNPPKASEADRNKSFVLFTKACDLGNADGCSRLATMNGLGWGVPMNRELSKQGHDKACAMGEQESCRVRDKMASNDQAEAQAIAERNARQAEEQRIAVRFAYSMPTSTSQLQQCFVIKTKFDNEINAFNARAPGYVSRSQQEQSLDPNKFAKIYTQDSERTCMRLLDFADESGNNACYGATYSEMMSRIPQFDAVSPYSGQCYKRSRDMGANWNVSR